MAKSTAVVVGILVTFVVLLVLVNLLGHKNSTPAAKSTPTNATGKPAALIAYPDYACGVELNYPNSLNVLDGPTGSVIFTGKTDPKKVIIVTCQKDIPRPSVTVDKIEQLTSGSVSAILYHDTSSKDGTPIDKLIFNNPDNDLDIFISGYGAQFQQIIGNIKLIQ